ncbi:peptidoglycan DD-metalloendopeptidase family protein [Paenibacillus spongiae]|uniref:Peptidoglycan DD-metalloendopeptidase family protein n=1 Tax=Paenibacillus spongiae TaxID=2909671 RepID=A0ABY5S8S2_9BACL|nr:peptidoglycan DD-metalloendopeptidase family protein [Paenibacillus spongiae]UVI30301.1 peptidoglycan DD-metalloendopeptidase family protein [Paenibacillus spongiae]
MTVFKDKDRIRKVWSSIRPTFRRDRSQLESMTHDVSFSRMKRRKSIVLAGAAIAVLILAGFGGSQYVKANTVDYYHLYMNGNLVGEVHSSDQVQQLISHKQQEVSDANPDVNMVLKTGNLTYEPKSAYKAKPDSEATLKKLETMFTAQAQGVELQVDGEVVGIVKDQATADKILSRVKTRYAPEQPAAKNKALEVSALAYSANKAQEPAKTQAAAKPSSSMKSVEIVEEVTTSPAEVKPEQIADPQEMYLKLVKGSVKPTKYTVQAGDCIGCIAQKFDISPQVIYENNNWIKDDEIKVGDVLDLTVLQPEVTVETVEHVTEMEQIEPITVIQKNSNMRAGESKTIRNGKSGKKKVVYKLVKQNGYLMSEELLGEQVLEPSVPAIVMKGTKVILGEGSGRFAWPVSGAKLTSSFGKRWGRQHKGIDMVGSSSILAADNGVVEFAGDKNGLGRAVIINHKNGYKTVYGHMSKLSVKSGQTVEKGDKIGVMGNTGHSFGTHLHFEIHKNGKVQNPIKYL